MSVVYPVFTDLFEGAYLRELVVSATPRWTAFNPSISYSPADGYRFVVRSSNFRLDETQWNHLLWDPESIFRTRNFIGRMDNDLAITELTEIDYSAVTTSDYPYVTGSEDARLYWDYQDRIWKMSSSYRLHSGITTIAVDTLSGNNVIARDIKHRGEDPEKNWMPTGRLYPFTPEFFYGPWGYMRGSSQAVQIGLRRHLGITHETTGPERQYWHRLVLFDADGNIRRKTDPFYFKAPGVEFANGLAEWRNYWVITLGYREVRAFMAFIPKEEVKRAFAD